jgi:hypothetical protein
MRSKRVMMLVLSAVMALITVALTAPAVSADYDKHPNVVIQIAIRLDAIDTAGGNYVKARESLGMLKDIRHWLRDHDDPRFVKRSGSTCQTAFDDWLDDSVRLARLGFVYFRGQATNWQEYPPGWERQAARVRAKLMYNRIKSNQEDATDDFLDDCVLNMPRRARGLLF